MTDDERASQQRALADAIRWWHRHMHPKQLAATMDLVVGSATTPALEGGVATPIMPWALALAVAAADDRIWDAIVQVRQAIVLMESLERNN